MSISTRGSAVPYEAPRSPGFRRMFREGHLTLGLFFAIESYVTDMPTMAGQVELARKAEADGFAALWTRDVPLRDPTFGEVGQIFDPWVWRGYVTAHTSTIALATGAIVLPIIRCTWRRRPRPCTTCRRDGSCWGASGDRPIEFPAFGRDIEAGVNFFTSRLHTCSPRCAKTRLVSNQRVAYCMAQSLFQSRVMIASRLRSPAVVARTSTGSRPTLKIHLGFRLGTVALIDLLERLRDIGVNHVVLNLKYGRRPAAEMLDDLAQTIVLLFLVHRLDAG